MKEAGKETLFGLRDLLEKRKEELKRIARELERNVTIETVDQKKLEGLRCVVAGVDGGCYVFDELSISLLALRAASAIMRIEGGRISSIHHIPAGYIKARLLLIEDEEDDAGRMLSVQTMRVLEEVTLAREVAQAEKPDILFLHGPLLPHFLARATTLHPADEENAACSRYRAVLEKLAEIMKLADANGMIVAGVVEDSRGRTLLNSIVDNMIVTGISDSTALDLIMNKGQYTTPLPYANPTIENSISRFYPELSATLKRVFIFYLKNAAEDIPLRIEFYQPASMSVEHAAERIAESVIAQTLVSTYSIPAVLVEADRRARIRKKEAELLLLHELGSEALKLVKRRKRRFV